MLTMPPPDCSRTCISVRRRRAFRQSKQERNDAAGYGTDSSPASESVDGGMGARFSAAHRPALAWEGGEEGRGEASGVRSNVLSLPGELAGGRYAESAICRHVCV